MQIHLKLIIPLWEKVCKFSTMDKEISNKAALRVRTVAKRHMRSPMFAASFILVSCVKLPYFFGITKDGNLY